MALDHVNIYALDDGNGWTIVDTGMGSNKTRGLWRDLMARELGGRPITRVILTHHHPDHVGLAGWFKSEYGAEIWATRYGLVDGADADPRRQELPTSETLDFWRKAGMDPVELDKRANGKPFNFADTVHPIPLGFRRIKEGDKITMGGWTWDIRIGNGHAPERATFWCATKILLYRAIRSYRPLAEFRGLCDRTRRRSSRQWLDACE